MAIRSSNACLLTACCALILGGHAATSGSTEHVSLSLLDSFKEDENVLVSGLSVSTCFSLVLPGAKGETRTQIATALAYPDSASDVAGTHQAFSDLRESYNRLYPAPSIDAPPLKEWETPPPVLQIANSIWVDQGLSLAPAYQQLIDNLLVVADFSSANSSTALNSWVATKTNNKIKSIVSPGKLPGVMIAVNAVYFKATWQHQFEESNTGLGTFYTSSTRQTALKTDCHIMHQIGYFEYAETSTHQVLRMPYAGTKLEMVLVRPLGALNAFSKDDLAAAISSMKVTRIALALPKFEFEAGYSLNDPLKSMGMVLPFSDQADFSDLSSTPLFISEVIHKTFIAVDEFGTEAAAVTAIVMEATSVKTTKPPTPVLFQADHPFMFLIRDSSDGNVLFAGQVGNPSAPDGSAEPTFVADGAVWQNKFDTALTTSASTIRANYTGSLIFMLLLMAQNCFRSFDAGCR